MRWSFHLARVSGIEVRVHVTFFLLLALVGLTAARGGGVPAAVVGVVFVCLVFLCVLLHEFGHALAARRYGIETPDITLLPIGGVARLERMPDRPVEEIVVALAGPAVNVAIAAVLWLFVGPVGWGDLLNMQAAQGSLWRLLLVSNLLLVAFNLIPAFPMDGGRVLRALLAMRFPYARATQMAATLGQFLAICGGMWGLLNERPMLALVAVFIYFGAQSEAAMAQLKGVTAGLRVSEVMVTDFQSLPLTATLNDAVEALLRTSQHDFPVLDPAGHVAGLLTRDDLIAGLRKAGADAPVAPVMRPGPAAVHHSMRFDRALILLQRSGSPALPVLDSEGRLIGLFTPENVGEMMMVRSALAAAPRGAAPPAPLVPA